MSRGPYPKQKPYYAIATPELISAATVIRSAPSFGLTLCAKAKLNPTTPLTPGCIPHNPNLWGAVP